MSRIAAPTMTDTAATPVVTAEPTGSVAQATGSAGEATGIDAAMETSHPSQTTEGTP